MIAIIDDEKAARDELEFMMEKYFSQCNVVTMASGNEFLDFKDKEKLSIVFLDIHLGDIDGLAIAKMIKELNNEIIIVLVTAYDKYALKSYEIGVFDYITKPIIEHRFESLVRRIESETDVLKRKMLSITSNKITYVINTEDIIYIEYLNRKTTIVTDRGSFNTTLSLNKLLSLLPCSNFFRTHKSYIVNIDFIESIELDYATYYDINIIGQERLKIPLSRNKVKELKQMLNVI